MKSTTLPLVLVLAAAAGCETGGVYELFKRRDVIETCSTASSTWIRTEGVGTDTTTVRTEILVIGTMLPTAPVDATMPRCFQRMMLEYDASTILDVGSYTLDAAGNGVFEAGATYDYQIMRVPLFDRPGALRMDHAVPVAHPIAIQQDNATLLVTYDGVQHRYTSLFDVHANIDLSNQAGVDQAFLLTNLPMFMSQTRVPGFGSTRMTTYVAPARFNAILGGEFTVGVQSLLNPTTNIEYLDFVDMTGTYIDGLQITRVNAMGTGPMDGTVTVTLRDGPLLTDQALVATIDYSGIHITNGFPDNGEYVVSITVPSAMTGRVAHDIVNKIDIRGVLPVTTP